MADYRGNYARSHGMGRADAKTPAFLVKNTETFQLPSRVGVFLRKSSCRGCN